MKKDKKQIQNKAQEMQKIFAEHRQKLRNLEKELFNTILDFIKELEQEKIKEIRSKL